MQDWETETLPSALMENGVLRSALLSCTEQLLGHTSDKGKIRASEDTVELPESKKTRRLEGFFPMKK